jgi:hypothetical protein
MMKITKEFFQDPHRRPVPSLEKGAPLLQKDIRFEHTVSRLIRKSVFHYNFITNMPERPALSSKQDPHSPPVSRGKRSNNTKELSK